MQINQTTITVVHASLLDCEVQGIVNAANQAMRGGGGIDGAIHSAAGPELLAELKQVAPHGAKTGTAVLTKGYRLTQPYVIHTPGPVWSAARAAECERLLRSCYRSCLEIAKAERFESIGFCSISTGVYGYPIEKAAPVAVDIVIQFLQERPNTSLTRVVFAMRGLDEFETFTAAVRDAEAQYAKTQS